MCPANAINEKEKGVPAKGFPEIPEMNPVRVTAAGGVDELRKTVLALMGEESITQVTLARESGVAPSTLNQFLKGKYEGSNETIAELLSRWLETRNIREQAAMQLPDAPEYLSTPTSRKILGVLLFAQMARGISVIYGSPGIGKTMTFDWFCSKGVNVWKATIDPSRGGVAACLEEIAEAVGLRNAPGRSSRLSRELERRLKDTKGLLIIDEAQHLSIPALEAIRAIHDASGIGLVLAGNETVYTRLTGGNRSAQFAQLFSRVSKRVRLIQPTAEDVAMLAESFAVTGKEELAELNRIASKPGALRSACMTLQLAGMIAMADKTAVNVKHIRAAWRDLSGE